MDGLGYFPEPSNVVMLTVSLGCEHLLDAKRSRCFDFTLYQVMVDRRKQAIKHHHINYHKDNHAKLS